MSAHETASRGSCRPRFLLVWYEERGRNAARYGEPNTHQETWYSDPHPSLRAALRDARLVAWDHAYGCANNAARNFGPWPWPAPESGMIYDLERGTMRVFDFGASIRAQRAAAQQQVRREMQEGHDRERTEATRDLARARARAAKVGVRE